MKRLVIGTRGSALALTQARWVIGRLRERWPDLDVREKVIATRGDRVQDRPLAAIGEKGVFVREIEAALAAGEIDAAVHSLKDLPAALPRGFCLAAVPEGEDPRDCLVAPAFGCLDALPQCATVGTGSPRRQAQIRALRPDLRVRDIRGNVDTRLRKVREGDYDAAVLACAGLLRLGLGSAISQRFSPEEMTPAIGQGVLAIEARADDQTVIERLLPLDDAATRAGITAERALARELGAGCSVPLGAHARVTQDGSAIRLTAALCDPTGETIIRKEAVGPAEDPDALGIAAARMLLDAGGAELLAPFA